MSKSSVKATCIVSIEVECDSCWSSTTTMEQIIRQAEQDAQGRIARLFTDAESDDKDLTVKRSGYRGLRMIGVQKITTQAIVDK